MKQGDVILTPIPQADGRLKNRPAIVLREMPPYKDVLVCGISTQVRHCVEGFDEIISPDQDDFQTSGLKSKSLIRLGFFSGLASNRYIGSNRFNFTNSL